VTVKVQNVSGNPLAGVVVGFKTSVGTLGADQMLTAVDGVATNTLTASASAMVTVTAGKLEAHTLIAAQPPSTIPLPPPPPPPPPPTPPGALSVTLSTQDAIVGQANIFQANTRNAVFPSVYVWAFGDGATFSGSTPSSAHVYGAIGSYAATVTVTDADGRTASAGTTATTTAVPPPPGPPAAVPSYTVTLVAAPTSVVINIPTTLTATANPQNGAPPVTSYDWDCDGDGTPETLDTPGNTSTCAYPASGTKQPKVTAKSTSVRGTATTTVTVLAAAPFFVNITALTLTPTINTSITFTATVTSTAVVPLLLQWQWDDTNDGTYDTVVPAAASPNAHATVYGSTGVKTVKVRVFDAATGREAIGLLTLTVIP
jgi:hypothetical protein